jgi:hypothetical protein
MPDSVTRLVMVNWVDIPCNKISIGANVKVVDDSYHEDANNSFANYYNDNGKKAGTYTRNERTELWSFKAR